MSKEELWNIPNTELILALSYLKGEERSPCKGGNYKEHGALNPVLVCGISRDVGSIVMSFDIHRLQKIY